MFTTSFQKETFHCKSFIRSFQEWVWIKSMSKMISLSKGMEEQEIYLTRWTIQPLFCGKLLVPKLPEFEDFMDRNKNLTESSTKHCEDSQTFRKRFSFHVDRLIKCTTVNPFMQDHLTKLNNNKNHCSWVYEICDQWFWSYGRKAASKFVSASLVVRKVQLYKKLP